MTAALAKLEAALERLLRGLVIALMTTLAAVVVIGVAFRKAGAALAWYDEIAATLLAWLTFYGAGLAALKRAHIAFPKLVEAAPPPVRTVLLVVRTAVVVAFFAGIVWAGWRVLAVLHGHYLISLPWVPVRLTQSVVPIGAALFILAEVVSAARLLTHAGAPEHEEPGA